MRQDPHNLLILKAFQMGNRISESPSKTIALKMATCAIEQLRERTGDTEAARLFFYLMLKAEALRGSNEAGELRTEAKDVAEQVGGSLYEGFLSIIDATEGRVRLKEGLQKHMIVDPGVLTRGQVSVDGPWGPMTVTYDRACAALGVKERELTPKELQFIHECSLKTMLASHKIDLSELGIA